MNEFNASKLVEAVGTYFKADRHIKERGYSAPIYGIKRRAQEVMMEQAKAYEAQKNQKVLKLK